MRFLWCQRTTPKIKMKVAKFSWWLSVLENIAFCLTLFTWIAEELTGKLYQGVVLSQALIPLILYLMNINFYVHTNIYGKHCIRKIVRKQWNLIPLYFSKIILIVWGGFSCIKKEHNFHLWATEGKSLKQARSTKSVWQGIIYELKDTQPAEEKTKATKALKSFLPQTKARETFLHAQLLPHLHGGGWWVQGQGI